MWRGGSVKRPAAVLLEEIGDEARDCSMKCPPREVALAKLGIMVEGSKILGAELAGRRV